MEKSYKESLVEMMIPKSLWVKKLPAGPPVRKKAKHSFELARNLPQTYELAGTEPQYSFIEST